MLAAGIALLILGYSFVYSGSSKLYAGDKGWGLIQSITGQGTGAPSKSAFTTLFSNITPQGNSGATPTPASSPVSGAQQV